MIVFAYILAVIVLLIVLLIVTIALSYIVTTLGLKFAFWVCKKLGIDDAV